MSATRHHPGAGDRREAAPVLEALLTGGLLVELPVTGASMLPTLRPGDRVVIAPFLGLPAPGQIVAARAAAGIVVHRLALVEMRDGRRLYRTQGDAERGLDAGVRREQMIGRVVEVMRAGQRLPVPDGPWERRRALFRLALLRRRPRLVRAAASVALAAALALGPARAALVQAGGDAAYAPAADYRFAPGDVLSLRVWNGEAIDEKQLTVQSDGTAFLPISGLGSVDIGGRTPSEAKGAIETRLARIYKEVYTELLVVRYAGHRVQLMGEIKTTARIDSGPGEWPLQGPTRLVSFLSAHGGPTPEADLMRVQVVRRSGETVTVNLFKAVFQQSDADNPELANGDFVFVPSLAMGTRKVFVLGDVGQPGVVTIYDRMTLVEALARCGGVSRRGSMKEIAVIRRRADAQPEMQVVDLKDLLKTGRMGADLELAPGDIVYVPRGVLGTIQDVFTIISPALQTIESLYIIDNFRND